MNGYFIKSHIMISCASSLDDEIFSSHFFLAFNNLLLSVDDWTLDKITKQVICQNFNGCSSVSNVKSNFYKKVSTSRTI